MSDKDSSTGGSGFFYNLIRSGRFQLTAGVVAAMFLTAIGTFMRWELPFDIPGWVEFLVGVVSIGGLIVGIGLLRHAGEGSGVTSYSIFKCGNCGTRVSFKSWGCPNCGRRFIGKPR